MGGYRQALATASPTPDITQSRHYRHQAGLGVSIDQELASDFGVFFRASWRDGQSEVWQFTDVDRNMSAGLQLKGQHWRRPNDTIGIAGILSAITSAHRDFLAAGGLGPVVGDGQLPHYANEKVLELYYNLALNTHLFLTTDFQWAENPGYNPDRGPIPIISGRAHFEF
jgi:high affinity Mn2+ porin